MMTHYQFEDFMDSGKILWRVMYIIAGVIMSICWIVYENTMTPEETVKWNQEQVAKRESEKEAIEKKLPPGCTFNELGYFKDTKIYAVICPKEVTTTWTYPQGKGRATASISVERQ